MKKITFPISDDQIKELHAGDRVLASGYLYTARDAAHKRMYELLEILGPDFMQVSKSACINLKFLESVEPSFNGVMLLYLKDGEKEYISRKFVPKLKEYLGL